MKLHQLWKKNPNLSSIMGTVNVNLLQCSIAPWPLQLVQRLTRIAPLPLRKGFVQKHCSLVFVCEIALCWCLKIYCLGINRERLQEKSKPLFVGIFVECVRNYASCFSTLSLIHYTLRKFQFIIVDTILFFTLKNWNSVFF